MRKILVALDGSSRERSVLDAAIAVGCKMGAKLVLFRSVGVPFALPPDAFCVSPQDLPAMLQSLAKSELEKLNGSVPSACKGTTLVTIGTPWQSIETAAMDEDVDLIVIGSHGYDALDRLIGTTAAKVVNHADRAVLVVRAAERLTSN